MTTPSVISPSQSTLQSLKFSIPTETYVSPYSVQPIPSAILNDDNSSVIWEAKNGSVVHASTFPMTCTEQDDQSGSSASLLTSIVSAERSVNQCASYSSGHSSDNELDNSNVLSLSRSKVDQEIVQPLAWNTLATDTMDNNALSYEFPMPKDAWKSPWSSINIGLVIRERKPIVLDGEKYWIVEWERSYIHESETFGVHWDLFVDHEVKTSMLESKHPEVSKRKPGRPRKSASSRFSKRSTTLKSRKPL